MSDKRWCPVCDSYTSSIHYAVSRRDACPYCGTPAALIEQIDALREKKVSDDLLAQLGDLSRRVRELEAENARWRGAFAVIQRAIADQPVPA